MKSRTRQHSRTGAVLVFALLVLVVGATILGGVAQLAVTQSIAGQTEWASVSRRVQLENSRALARQYVLSMMFRSYGGLSRGTLDAGSLGRFSITNIDPDTGFWLSLAQNGTDRINPFNIFERGGFQSAWATAQLRGGTNDIPWGFQVRTRSPIVAGFAFVNHRNATNAWTASQFINMQRTNYATGFASLPLPPVSSVTTAAIGGAGGYTGLLSVPRGEAPFGDFYETPAPQSLTIKRDGANAEVVLNLDLFNYYNPDGCLFYEVPSIADVTVGQPATVTKLTLIGGGADKIPLQILVPDSNSSLTSLVLKGNNQRAVYFYRRSPVGNLVVSTDGADRTFRIGMTLYCTADLAPAGTLTMVGGIRTGRALGITQGTVVFAPETGPNWRYDAIADRMMWLEDQRIR